MPGVLKLDISNEKDLPAAAGEVLAFAGNSRVFLFDAPMGAGKTTFIKMLCRALGSQDNFSSPTYAIVNEYASPAGKIYHFDLYRLKTEEELYDLGFEEYLHSNAYCFIEWPEVAHEMISPPYIGIHIDNGEGKRQLRAENHN